MANNTVKIANDNTPLFLGKGLIAYDEYRGGIYVCGFVAQQKIAVVTRITKENAGIPEALDKLFSLLSEYSENSEIAVKIVGEKSQRNIAVNYLKTQSINIAGEGDIKELGLRIYFDAATSKIKIEQNISIASTKSAKDPNRIRKVLIVDDSGTMRKLLRQTFESNPLLTVVAEAARPTLVEDLIRKHSPDVITLDIHMPEMDGITLLKKLNDQFSIPIVMISSISLEEGTEVLKALELGAVDYIEKPRFDEVEANASIIIEKVLAASDADVSKAKCAAVQRITGKLPIDTPIVIGSSTGGTEALKTLLTALPEQIPPILIVQHIPAVFSAALAKRLNDLCPFEVCEAKDRDAVKAGRVLIAPGGFHMTVKGSIKASTVHTSELPNGYQHKPAVDVLFDSAVKAYGGDCTGIILTGMGKDGANGLKKLKVAGALTIAQDEASCVVYGMPRAAVELGAVGKILPLTEMAEFLARSHSKKKKAA